MAELYSLEDFLENERFLEWFRSPDPENDAYWKEWLEANPSQRPVFESAVAAMALLGGDQPEFSDKYIRQKVAVIKENMAEGPPAGKPVFRVSTSFLRWAAVVVVTTGLGWLLVKPESFFREKSSHSSVPVTTDLVKSFANNGDEPTLINLPDGSSVVLTTGSKIEYVSRSGSFRREVKLTGEGFFEVVKDPANPFYVYTTHLITRVLGTSFLVRSFDNEPKATVTVRTGAVTVIPQKGDNRTGKTSPDTLLLTPNEQVSLVVATDEMIRQKWSSRQNNPLPQRLQHPAYEFHLTPVADVFALLEQTYGVTIQYDAEKLKNCTLTATLSDEPFLDKIRMICIGIEADFEMSGNRITVTGNGCANE
ncbi:FecR family protein [Ravibacter arvi]|uniref:FecR family protein n=1 Tax=Ravibacter arvi TaxID=2051041 RepID=A0ABP8LMC2_9BACT